MQVKIKDLQLLTSFFKLIFTYFFTESSKHIPELSYVSFSHMASFSLDLHK